MLGRFLLVPIRRKSMRAILTFVLLLHGCGGGSTSSPDTLLPRPPPLGFSP